jgi:hypothetical protein
MVADRQRCRQNADQPRGATTDPPGRTLTCLHRAVALPLHKPPAPHRQTHPQVGIGPEARPERKKPSLVG